MHDIQTNATSKQNGESKTYHPQIASSPRHCEPLHGLALHESCAVKQPVLQQLAGFKINEECMTFKQTQLQNKMEKAKLIIHRLLHRRVIANRRTVLHYMNPAR